MGRKYKQKGYMDGDYDPRDLETGTGATVSFGSLLKILPCAKCGERNSFPREVKNGDSCSRCGTDLHSCVHCDHYDRGSRFECRLPMESRVEQKEMENTCIYFSGQYVRDAQTKRPMTNDDARKALDKLFPF